MLRQLNRRSNYRLKKLRDSLGECRFEAENAVLTQNNLNSEVSHIKRNIAACLDFKSLDQDLELCSLEEFKEKAPAVLELDDEIYNDEHKLYLARLKFEIHQRNQMLESIQELENRRTLLNSDISGKEHRIRQVEPIVDKLRENAKELIELLGV